jgi:hypothetical protein
MQRQERNRYWALFCLTTCTEKGAGSLCTNKTLCLRMCYFLATVMFQRRPPSPSWTSYCGVPRATMSIFHKCVVDYESLNEQLAFWLVFPFQRKRSLPGVRISRPKESGMRRV